MVCQDLVQSLGRMMSDVSEDCYYAGWLGGTEYFVPELCRRAVASGQIQYWGHGEITPSHAAELTALAEQAGSWADIDDACVGYEAFQPFPIPPHYIAALDREMEHHQSRAAKPGRAAE